MVEDEGGAARTDGGPVRGDKSVMPNANLQDDFGDFSVEKANTRPPYNSTIQLSYAGRGEKFTQDFSQGLVDYEDHQADVANTRIPYTSTLQINDDDEEEDL